jgi:hypothetical protein
MFKDANDLLVAKTGFPLSPRPESLNAAVPDTAKGIIDQALRRPASTKRDCWCFLLIMRQDGVGHLVGLA